MEVTLICANTLRAAKIAVDNKIKALDPTDFDGTNYIVVPDRSTLDAEKSLLKHAGGSFNTQVVTFKNLAKRLAPQSSGIYLNKQNGVLLLSEIAHENASELKCFTKSFDTDGFADKVYEVVSALKYARILPQQLAADDLPLSLRNKLADIKLLYSAYVDAVKGRFFDSADTLEQLLERLTADTVGNCRFYLYDFLSFTAQEKRVLARLIVNAKSVTVSAVAIDSPNRASVADNAVAMAVKAICDETGCGFKKEFFTEYSSPVSQKLASALFFNTPIKSTAASDGAVVVSGATGVDDEVCALARFIGAHVREGGAYKDVKVVCSDVAKYAYSINRRFSDFEIPFYLDEKTSLDKTATAEYLLAFLDCHAANMGIEKILRFAKNPLTGLDVSAFETFVAEYGIDYDYGEFDIGKENALFAEADAVRAEIKKCVCDVDVPRVARAADYVEILRKVSVEHDLAKKAEEYAKKIDGYGYRREADILMQAQAKTEEVFSQVSEIFGDATIGLERFIMGLKSSLASQTVSVLPTKKDCVFISNLDKGKDHDVKILAILGANEGELPKVYKNCALLSDKNVEDLSARGLSVDISLEQKNRQERFCLFNLLCEPTEKLYVSYRTGNGKDETHPSTFVSVIRKCFENTNPSPVIVETKKTALNEAISALVALREKNVPTEEQKACLNLLADEAKKYDVFKSRVSDVTVGDELFFNGDEFSVTRIERFFECPFKHFLVDGLGLNEQKTADFKPSDFGNVLHEVFDRYVSELRRNPACDENNAEAIFDSVMQEERNKAFLKTARGKAVCERLKKEAVFHCENIRREIANGDFRPFRTEFEFCKKDGTAPTFVVDGKTYFLKGFIDRVDVSDDGKAVVYDYKTGNPVFSEKLLYGGLKLQLFVYASAVKRLGFEPIACFYYKISTSTDSNTQKLLGRAINDVGTLRRIDASVKEGEKSSFLGVTITKKGTTSGKQKSWIAKDEFDACRRYAEEIITRACRLMRRGYVEVSPAADACKYCQGRGVCGFSDTRIKNERNIETVSVKDFLGMTEDE